MNLVDNHPRFKLHFTPTSASWMNLIERFFAEITSRRIRRGSYSSVDDLEAAIFDDLAQYNEKPKPFQWTKTAEDILTRERRAFDKLDEIRRNSRKQVGSVRLRTPSMSAVADYAIGMRKPQPVTTDDSATLPPQPGWIVTASVEAREGVACGSGAAMRRPSGRRRMWAGRF